MCCTKKLRKVRNRAKAKEVKESVASGKSIASGPQGSEASGRATPRFGFRLLHTSPEEAGDVDSMIAREHDSRGAPTRSTLQRGRRIYLVKSNLLTKQF